MRIRPAGRSLLFDCGQISHLAKRILRSVDALFITHAHMDHFMGMDTFVRHVHVSPRTIEIFGPPGLGARLEKKLAGYDWNLAEPTWCSLRVHEIHPGFTRTALLTGERGFALVPEGDEERQGRVIFENRYVKVEADVGDHRIPVLFFRLTEKAVFAVDEEKIAREGLPRGPWLGALKKSLLRGRPEEPVQVPGRGDEAAGVLYARLRKEEAPASLGYLTDVGFSEGNWKRIVSLLRGVTLLVAECAFLAGDRDKARASWHLCTDDLNALVREVRPRYLLPMHLSKAYALRTGDLYRELEVPEGTTLLRIPDHIPPRPLLPGEVPPPVS